MYKRKLNMNLEKGVSAFLWGARKTGKSTYLRERFGNKSVFYDLLNTELYVRLANAPHIFREEIMALPKDRKKYPIIVDEVQKIPELLDEIHWLIENEKAQFILCGSSARKMKQKGVNLLGGRAWKYNFYPLVYPEISDFDLLKVLTHGTIPSHYNSENWYKTIRAYVEDYLVQEIKAEGLARSLPAFSRFLEAASIGHGGMLNYTNISRECGIDAKTVKEYYQILVDTLLGYFLYPFSKSAKRALITASPKFYFFDVGLANYLGRREIKELKGPMAGSALEHYIFLELTAYNDLNEKRWRLYYWRTKTGLEVDFVIDSGDKLTAIEVKISDHIHPQDLKGLKAFIEEYPGSKGYLICNIEKARLLDTNILALPIKYFLERLWQDKMC